MFSVAELLQAAEAVTQTVQPPKVFEAGWAEADWDSETLDPHQVLF